jgi:hypothetical protein
MGTYSARGVVVSFGETTFKGVANDFSLSIDSEHSHVSPSPPSPMEMFGEKLIKKMRDARGIVYNTIYSCDYARARFGPYPGEGDVITSPRPKDEETLLTYLHELGHLTTFQHSRGNPSLLMLGRESRERKEDELAAWESAFKRYRRYGLVLTQELYDFCEGYFNSYVNYDEHWIASFRSKCKLEEFTANSKPEPGVYRSTSITGRFITTPTDSTVSWGDVVISPSDSTYTFTSEWVFPKMLVTEDTTSRQSRREEWKQEVVGKKGDRVYRAPSPLLS